MFNEPLGNRGLTAAPVYTRQSRIEGRRVYKIETAINEYYTLPKTRTCTPTLFTSRRGYTSGAVSVTGSLGTDQGSQATAQASFTGPGVNYRLVVECLHAFSKIFRSSLFLASSKTSCRFYGKI